MELIKPRRKHKIGKVGAFIMEGCMANTVATTTKK